MNNITMDLYQDWIDAIKELFRKNGHTQQGELSNEDIAIRYFLQNSPSEQVDNLVQANKQRFQDIQKQLLDHMDTVVIPDIRNRTGYAGKQFHFKWVYYEGEHIIEERSEYRIPL